VRHGQRLEQLVRPEAERQTPARPRIVLSAAGTAALLGGAASASWARLMPGLLVAGIGSGLLNAALPRLAVESVPADRAAMGSGANNTARYIGSAAGVALTVAISTAHRGGNPVRAPAHGADLALLVATALALAAAVLVFALKERQAGGAMRRGERHG
jgi:MFS family permease